MRRISWGIVIVLIGLWIWASKLGLPETCQFRKDWPILIVLFGAFISYRSARRWSRRRRRKTNAISELEQGKIGVDEAVDRLKKGK
jgi:uncharacterized sodium:solute symporter family permease YidK